jgi:multidrug resistance efflux pump
VAQAAASVSKAQADLNKVLAGNTVEYIASLQAALAQAQATLEQTKATSANSVSAAESALETAKNNLKLAEGGENSQIVQDAFDNMVSLLQAIQNVLVSSLAEADNILGIDNTLANDGFESALSNLDANKKGFATNAYNPAKIAKDSFAVYKSLSTASSHEQIDLAANVSEDALTKMNGLLIAVSDMLEKTTPVGGLTQAGLDTLKANINTARTNTTAKYTLLLAQKQTIKTAKNSYTSYNIAYDKAVQDLESAKKKAEADVAIYQAAVDKAQATLDDAKNPPREVDVAAYRAAVASAQASLAQAVANHDKAIIKAPVDGTVGKIVPRVGEYVTSQDVVIKLVSQLYQVKVDIAETDVVKIAIGNDVSVELDAYGDGVKFSGKVIQIEKGETVVQDVIYYRVTISLDNLDPQYQIYNGMTANVTLSTAQKNNVLIIPQRAVKTNGSGPYVRMLENGQPKDVLVKLGLRGDGGMVEVVEGLSEGQEAVVNVIEGKK